MVDSAPLSRSPSTASLRLVLAWSTPLRCPALRAQLRFVSSWHGRLRSAVPLSEHSFASSRPGMVDEHRDGDSNPALRVEGPVSSPLDHRGVWRKRGDSNAQGPRDPHLFSGQAPHPAGSLPRAEGVGLAPTRAVDPYPRSKRAPHLAGSLPWGPRWESHPRPRPYQGRALAPELRGPGSGSASPARFERAASAFGGRRSAPLSYGEVGVDGRGRTCNFRIRSPAPSPFGYVDERATDGIRTRDLRLDGPALRLAELRRLGTRPGTRTQSVPG